MKSLSVLCLVLLMIFTFVVPAFAYPSTYDYNGSVLPFFLAYDSIKDDYPSLMLVSSERGYFMYAFDEVPYATDTGIVASFYTIVSVYSLSEDESTWEFSHQLPISKGSSIILYSNGDSRQWSNFDIYSISGTLYFEGDKNFTSAPLAKKVLNLSEELLKGKVLPALAGAIQILTACGVGCLALLTVLKLLGKRSLIYRS